MSTLAPLSLLLRHEVRINWRLMSQRVSRKALIASVIGFLALMHVVALPFPFLASETAAVSPVLVMAALTGAGVFALMMMISIALIGTVKLIYSRSDMDLLLSSPVPPQAIVVVRVLTIAFGIFSIAGAFTLPFANVMALFGYRGLSDRLCRAGLSCAGGGRHRRAAGAGDVLAIGRATHAPVRANLRRRVGRRLFVPDQSSQHPAENGPEHGPEQPGRAHRPSSARRELAVAAGARGARRAVAVSHRGHPVHRAVCGDDLRARESADRQRNRGERRRRQEHAGERQQPRARAERRAAHRDAPQGMAADRPRPLADVADRDADAR